MVGIARRRHEFRAALWVRLAVIGALAFWASLGAWALAFDALPARATIGIAFFVLLFAGFALRYGRMAYVVDDSGVTVRGATGGEHFPWEGIERVRAPTLPLAGWEVRTDRGMFVLDAFVGGRAQLIDVIVARTGLFPDAAR